MQCLANNLTPSVATSGNSAPVNSYSPVPANAARSASPPPKSAETGFAAAPPVHSYSPVPANAARSASPPPKSAETRFAAAPPVNSYSPVPANAARSASPPPKCPQSQNGHYGSSKMDANFGRHEEMSLTQSSLAAQDAPFPVSSAHQPDYGSQYPLADHFYQEPAIDGLKIMFRPHPEVEDSDNSRAWQPSLSADPVVNSSTGNESMETFGSLLSNGHMNDDGRFEEEVLPQEREPLSEYWNEEENRHYTLKEMEAWNAQYYGGHEKGDQISDSWGTGGADHHNEQERAYLSQFEDQGYQAGQANEQSGQNYETHFGHDYNGASEATNKHHIGNETTETGIYSQEWNAVPSDPLPDSTQDQVVSGSEQEQAISSPTQNRLIQSEQGCGEEGNAHNEEPTYDSQDLLKSMQTLASVERENEAAAYCWNCQKDNVADANFCTNCGSRLKENAPVVSSNINSVIAPVGVITTLNSGPEVSSLHVSDPLGRLFGHCFASFGAGGKLLYSCPEKQVVFGISAGVPASIEKACPGHVIVAPCSDYLIDYEKYAPSPIFGGVLPANEWPAKEALLYELDKLLPQLTGYELLYHTLRESIDQEFK